MFWRIVERLQDRFRARRWNAEQDRALRAWLASDRYAQIRACAHEDRSPNPGATVAHARGWQPETCNACGIGMVRPLRRGVPLHDVDDVAREFGVDLTDEWCQCGHLRDHHGIYGCTRSDPGVGWECNCGFYVEGGKPWLTLS